MKKIRYKQVGALLLGVAIGGFGWMSIKSFADLAGGRLTPMNTLLFGLIGFGVTMAIIKLLKIKPVHLLG